MSSLFRKKNQQLLMISTRFRDFLYSKPRFGGFSHCEKSQHFRLFSSSCEDKQSFTASYLVNSCGLSLQTAKSVSKKVHFTNTKTPDSVLGLLRSYEFTNIHITKLVAKFPQVLIINSEKVLKPKLEFFESIGIGKENDDLAKFVFGNPHVLTRSIGNQLIPFYIFIKSAISNDEKVVKVYLRLARYVGADVQKSFVPNIALLKQIGVRKITISAILSSTPTILFRNHPVFEKIVNEIRSMGYDPTKSNFVHVMGVFFKLSKPTLKHKMEIYKTWGLSENELDFALKNYPSVLLLSEKKISNAMDFLVNKMGFKSVDIARYPVVLRCSLEKRVIPRCLVYKVLILKGLLLKEFSLAYLLNFSGNEFEKKFVTPYKKEVPQLLRIYQGKISPLELGFTPEDVYGAKLPL